MEGSADLLVGDSSVNLGGSDGSVSQDLAGDFHGNIIVQQHSGCAGVPCHMVAYRALQSCYDGYGLKVVVGLGVAELRQGFVVDEAFWQVGVFLKNAHG